MVEDRRKTILRWLVICVVLCIAIAPALPLVISTLEHPTSGPFWTKAFGNSLLSSLWLGAGVSLLSLSIGLPLGLLAALYRFPGRSALVLFQAMPLLLPSFLPCIGWSNLSASNWSAWFPRPSGFSGCVFVLGLQAVPLSFFATWAACQNLTASQIDVARLHGGEKAVLKLSARACMSVAILAALLGGILSLSDAGAPLIFGYRSVAVEIRTSFSALFDYELAGRQCLLLAGLVLLLTVPLLIFGLRSLASAMLARQTRPAVPYAHHVLRWVAMSGLLVLLVGSIVFPTLGLCLPATENPMFERALQKVASTARTTLIFTGGAGLIAVVLATTVALAAVRDTRARMTTLTVLLVLLAMPPALTALGVSRIATQSPPYLDWLTRSELTVALVLGLRFVPVAAVVMMRAVGSLSPSWNDAACIHGVSTGRLLVRVILAMLMPAIIVSLLLVAVLAAADITTTHLLQPPGSQSLPVAIFTVMANSPEGLVASLCLLYMACVAGLLIAALQFTRWLPRGRA